MRRVCLLQADLKSLYATRQELRRRGYIVSYAPKCDLKLLRSYRENPPDVFILDLSRRPAHSREVAIVLRQSPKTRHIPIIFCDGQRDKVEEIRAVLPDAIFCGRRGLTEAVDGAYPPAQPVRPTGIMNRYGSRTVAEKLGIRPGVAVALIDPPRKVENVLGNVEYVEAGGAVTLCFAHSPDGLRAGLNYLRGISGKSKCWILWRKKSAASNDGITEPLVRETGILLGLVDYKICSFDAIWSAMLFARRKLPPSRSSGS